MTLHKPIVKSTLLKSNSNIFITKQTREIIDIESFFGVKGLKEENIITKAQLSITFIGNDLFICKSFVNNLDCKYGEKAEIICREFADPILLIFYLLTYFYRPNVFVFHINK